MTQAIESHETPSHVVVIGAGVIGLMNALQLAKRGLRVIIIDHIKEPRSYKVGESLLVFSNMFLRTIGGLADFCREQCYDKDNLWFTYGMEHSENFHGKTEWALELNLPQAMKDAFESPERMEVMGHDVQIVRPEAEAIMAEQAHAHPNITFHDKGRVRDVQFNEQGKHHRVVWEDLETKEKHDAYGNWVIDCSGRMRLLARKLNHTLEDKECDDGFKTTAVWAQFSGISREQFDGWQHRFSDGDVMDRHMSTLHLWGTGYWIWVIPLAGGRISVGVTFDQRIAPAGKPQEQFWHFIRRYPVLEHALKEENILEFSMFRNVQHMTDTFVHPTRYGMVGDAGSIIDAYYSQGMSLAFVTSWHLTNIIEQDIKEQKLDLQYIERVNHNTRQDWHMLRNMVKYKYTEAIADARFFILSHVLDQAIFTGVSQQRHWLARWLFETGGDTAKETKEHKEFRQFLSKNLFYCRGGLLGKFFKPEKVRQLQDKWQRQLAERALWRLQNGIELPRARALVRFPSKPVPLQKLKNALGKTFVELSPPRLEPQKIEFVSARGTEKKVFLAKVIPVIILVKFLGLYFYDAKETKRLKKKSTTGKLTPVGQ